MPNRIDAMTRQGYKAGKFYDALCPMATGREAILLCMKQAEGLIASMTIIDDDTFFAYIHGFQAGWQEAAKARMSREVEETEITAAFFVIADNEEQARIIVNTWLRHGRL